MAKFSEKFLREVLFSGRAGLRYLNENPVQFEVWVNYALNPKKSWDLLLVPFDSTPASKLAQRLHDIVKKRPGEGAGARRIAPIEGAVAAELSLQDFIDVILPLSGFDLGEHLVELQNLIFDQREDVTPRGLTIGDLFSVKERYQGRLSPDMRMALLLALILGTQNIPQPRRDPGDGVSSENWTLDREWSSRGAGDPLFAEKIDLALPEGALPPDFPPMIWRVARNRDVSVLGVSTETIKADAARRVFNIDCSGLTWAVIDSGIDGSHPAFRDYNGGDFAIRVDKAYDFVQLRELISYDTILDKKRSSEILKKIAGRLRIGRKEAEGFLKRLREDAALGRPYDWEALEKLIEVEPDRLSSDPTSQPIGHGTHVAGVLAGDWREGERSVFRGVCPELRLYDLRVVNCEASQDLKNDTEVDTEFAVIAALSFVRWVNGRNPYITIHGANLSIGLDHDMANYACGRTPVCMACEATVREGVSIVVAAGNHGAKTFQTSDGSFSGYASVSIADPGNAASVITVGATHRERPFEYGVSFFSSRGPTGDGRLKPDVVAPGERIDGPLPNLGYGRLDGTSMAAPHVSGVAALLMARNPELIGDPLRIKSIIVNTATDLGRERHFQGAGLVDALRALESV